MPSSSGQSPPPPPQMDAVGRRRSVSGDGGLCFGFVFDFFCRRRTRRLNGGAADAKAAPEMRRFRFKQLRSATGSFAASRRVGQGGFGPVFRGALFDGKEIAVKLMDSGSLQGDREFQNEIFIADEISTQISSGRRRWIVPAIGYCSSMRKSRSLFWRAMTNRGACGSGDEDQPPWRFLLVYDLMHNGSLQDALLDRKCPELSDWSRRFAVALDIARGLEFLHYECDPPIIHGDIKPSNVLLDSSFSARIADFGLSMLKTSADADAASIFEEDPAAAKSTLPAVGGGAAADASPDRSNRAVVEEEEEGSVKEEYSRSMEAASILESEGMDRLNVDGDDRKDRIIGKDLWVFQDSGGVGEQNSDARSNAKDYVMEWIGWDIKKERRPKSDCFAAASSPSPAAPSTKKKKLQKRLDWWTALDDDDRPAEKNNVKTQLQAREWWREEFYEELNNKCNPSSKDDAGYLPLERKSKEDSKCSTMSSTPSTRGTLFYAAPEYGGGEPLSEKCDIYSYGVLLLVIVAGRRPLQVAASPSSPMSGFERASLVSWARKLALSGRLLDLVDSSLTATDTDQALLCITIALHCIQRMAACRPTSKDIVAMLSCQLEPPDLPLEFSPSPPAGFPFKSRRNGQGK